MKTQNTIRLTARESEVLTMIGGQGMSSKECSEALVVSKRTVDFHLANIFEKLNCNNRVKAYVKAMQGGLL
jgi:DNA-binding NarL/FixJ family response regulator